MNPKTILGAISDWKVWVFQRIPGVSSLNRKSRTLRSAGVARFLWSPSNLPLMSFSRTAKAVVVSCSLAASDQVTVDLTVTFYQVQARVLESQYEDDVYMVAVVKPVGIGDLIDEEGTIMEHGKFSFDLTQEIAIDTELEIEITGVGSSTGIC